MTRIDGKYIGREERWAAVCSRDAAAGDKFVYAVRTTGIFCRPGCSSRLPRPGNVEFFDDAASAVASGYRPCLRCRPEEAAAPPCDADLVRLICELMGAAESVPRLADLAAEFQLSPERLRALFRRATGLTPRSYAAALRAERARAHLLGGAGVTEALYAAGYGASSRFYADAPGMLGMRPGEYRSRGRGVAVAAAIAACRLGWVLVAATPRGVCAIELGDSQEQLQCLLRDRFPEAQYPATDATFLSWVAQAVAHVDQPALALDLPLDIQATAFQRRVWEALRAIPPGETRSYAEVAAAVGSPRAVRAIASACAANQLAVAIPCHRVVRSDGSLSGYRWGTERKRELLDVERKLTARDDRPA